MAARKNTEKQLTEYDKAVQMLTSLITQSFGVFKTEETLEDGSAIYYLHNKPTLGESQTIWKMTAGAFSVSSDGGRTWNAGMDAEGHAVVNVLSAVGINAGWIKAGSLSADRIQGGELVLGGKENGNGKLVIKDASGGQIGYIDNTGVHFDIGTFSGRLESPTGVFGGMVADGDTLSQTTEVDGDTYTIYIRGTGIDFGSRKTIGSAGGADELKVLEYLTVINSEEIETDSIYVKNLYIDAIRVSDAILGIKNLIDRVEALEDEVFGSNLEI